MRNYQNSSSLPSNLTGHLRTAYALDIRSLALFRILVSLVVLVDLVLRVPHTFTLYSAVSYTHLTLPTNREV